jgi:hypothetical protein
MICRCIDCNTATNVSLQKGVSISHYRCYCGGVLKKAIVTYLDGNHPFSETLTRIGLYGSRKGMPYFQAFKSNGKFFVKAVDKFIEIPQTL